MRAIEVAESVVISRPIEEVFEFVSSRANDHLWWSGVIESRQHSAAECRGLGATCVHATKLLGQVIEARIEVTGCDPPRSLTIASEAGLTPFTASCTFERAQSGGTTFAMRARVRAAGIFQRMKTLLVIPAMNRQARGNLRRLKDLLEATLAIHARPRDRAA